MYALASKYLWKSVPQWICLSATERYEVLSRFLLQTQLIKRLLRTESTISYVNHFLRTGNYLPRLKHGGANYVVVSDWIQAYIESLFLCNPMLYLSEIRETRRERDQDDLHTASASSCSVNICHLFIYLFRTKLELWPKLGLVLIWAGPTMN